jgi:hypothetical protein
MFMDATDQPARGRCYVARRQRAVESGRFAFFDEKISWLWFIITYILAVRIMRATSLAAFGRANLPRRLAI